MGYLINYSSGGKSRPRSLLTRYTALFFLLFLLLCHWFWPTGEETLRNMLFPWDVDVTAGAFSEFVEDIGSGTSFSHAAETFCRTVLVHGEDIR